MADRFYDLEQKKIVYEVPYADGQGTREPTLADAKKAGAKWVASVTTILSILDKGEGLSNWFVDLHLDAARGLGQLLNDDHEKWKTVVKHKADLERKKAPDLGVAIHAAYEDYWRYQLDNTYQVRSVERDVKPYVQALHIFAQEHGMKPAILEQVVANPAVGYCGTCDYQGSFENEQVIADYKSKKVKNNRPWFADNFWTQMAAYANADGVEKKAKILSIIVDTSRHGTYSSKDLPAIYHKTRTDIDDQFETFKVVAAAYYAIKKWRR